MQDGENDQSRIKDAGTPRAIKSRNPCQLILAVIKMM
jgi:hypothetical protein